MTIKIHFMYPDRTMDIEGIKEITLLDHAFVVHHAVYWRTPNAPRIFKSRYSVSEKTTGYAVNPQSAPRARSMRSAIREAEARILSKCGHDPEKLADVIARQIERMGGA